MNKPISIINNRKALQFSMALLVFLSLIGNINGQLEPKESFDPINNDPRKEEIQRYMGYEDLFFRYTTLPYDISMNTNESAPFVDIGFLYIMFLPLVVLFIVIKNKRLQILGIVLLSMYLISCFYFSKIFVGSEGHYINLQDLTKDFNWNWDNGIIGGLTFYIHDFAVSLFAKFYQSPLSDHAFQKKYTYPFIVLIYLGSILSIIKIKRRSSKNIVAIFLGFSVLFFLLSAGIVWYGFLLIPLSLTIIFLIFSKKRQNPISYFLKYSFVSLSFLTIAISFVLRISNLQQGDPPDDKGINLLFPSVFTYAVGHSTERQALDMVFPNISQTLDEINSNNDLVYKIGTSLKLHIKNNHERVFEDNQLGVFYPMLTKYGGGSKIYKLLKAYGFSYIILDLHTASIDKTEGKSLTKKYQVFLESIFNNPDLSLLNTDRLLEVQNSNGQISNVHGIFGKPKYYGNFAVFKIN